MFEFMKRGRPEKWSFGELECINDYMVFEDIKTISDTQSIRRAAKRKGLKVSVDRLADEKGAVVTLRGFIA